jgi:hypothetical protein
MERTRPAALTTIAVLNIVFGSLGLICSCFYGLAIGVLMTASPNNPDPKLAMLGEVADLFRREIPMHLPIEISVALYSIIGCFVLIAAGIGLLYIANWARILCFIIAITTILTQAANLLYSLLVLFPAVARIQARVGGDPVETKMSQVLRLGGISVVIIFSIVMISLLCMRSVREAFAPSAFVEDYDRGGFDEYDEHVRE